MMGMVATGIMAALPALGKSLMAGIAAQNAGMSAGQIAMEAGKALLPMAPALINTAAGLMPANATKAINAGVELLQDGIAKGKDIMKLVPVVTNFANQITGKVGERQGADITTEEARAAYDKAVVAIDDLHSYAEEVRAKIRENEPDPGAGSGGTVTKP